MEKDFLYQINFNGVYNKNYKEDFLLEGKGNLGRFVLKKDENDYTDPTEDVIIQNLYELLTTEKDIPKAIGIKHGNIYVMYEDCATEIYYSYNCKLVSTQDWA